MKRIILISTILILFTVPAYAVLVDNGDGTITDTDTNLMWLQDANYGNTSGYDNTLYGIDTNGAMTWADATTWADTLDYASYSDWRLPSSDTCLGYNCDGSEMGYLYYISLGNEANEPLPNNNPFINFQEYWYWSSTDFETDPNFVYGFTFLDILSTEIIDSGDQEYPHKPDITYAIAVRVVNYSPMSRQ